MAETELVAYEVHGAVAVLTLNRPEKLNALEDGLIRGLCRGLDQAEQDAGIRAVVLKGAGRAFSAGFDLKEVYEPVEHMEPMREECIRDYEMIMRFWDSPLPTIAAVHGYCLGGGFELTLACDITMAAEKAVFGAPEAKIGSGIVTLLLPWVCGPKRAKEILLLGMDRMTAEDGERFGFVNRVVAADELEQQAMRLAKQIADNKEISVRLIKQAINDGYDRAGLRQALEQGLEHCITIEADNQITGNL